MTLRLGLSGTLGLLSGMLGLLSGMLGPPLLYIMKTKTKRTFKNDLNILIQEQLYETKGKENTLEIPQHDFTKNPKLPILTLIKNFFLRLIGLPINPYRNQIENEISVINNKFDEYKSQVNVEDKEKIKNEIHDLINKLNQVEIPNDLKKEIKYIENYAKRIDNKYAITIAFQELKKANLSESINFLENIDKYITSLGKLAATDPTLSERDQQKIQNLLQKKYSIRYNNSQSEI